MKLGGGQRGCIALIIKERAFLRLSNVAFAPPPNPPRLPVHPANATQTCINEDNRQHVEKQKALRLHLDVDKALKNQIMPSLLDTCSIRKMKHGVTGQGSVNSLTLVTRLQDNCSQITQADLKEN